MSVYQLSSAERNVVRDYIRLGSLVRVAEFRGRSKKTIERQMEIARKKCGGVSLVQLAVLVDRVGGVEIVPQIATNTPERNSLQSCHLAL